MARKKSSTKKVHHRRRDILHVVPTALSVVGLTPIAASSSMEGWTSPLDYAMEGQYNNALTVLKSNLKSRATIKEVAEIEVMAVAAKYLGKKLGLNRLGTKDYKLF